MRLLPSALLVLSVSHALGYALEPRDTTPTPISFSPDEKFDGIDGAWSSFTLRVGTPQQYVRTFISWAGYQTWVVIPSGCTEALDYGSCSRSRGVVFDQNASTTWQHVGIFEFGIEQNLGYTGNAEYGYDVVGLGGPGEEGPTLKNTTVGGFAVEDFYLGVFGINPKPTNFTSFSDPSTSYLTLLREQSYIPSLSFGYTAGASYRFTGELASLTLGGYDSSKFIENDVTWTFAPDNSRDTVVVIQGITTPSQIESSPNPTSLLPSAIYAYLDATVPQIWLPVTACEAFEVEFGLVYDNTTELYLVNSTLHQSLLDRDASVTFTLGTQMSGGATVTIELPYSAFDLTAKAPYQGLSNDTTYFPLRRAMNETQYTIGRTFFQEAYISVDYESAKFNVSQCAWNQDAPTHLVIIPPTTDASSYKYYENSASSSSNSLGGADIAGVAVGAVAGLAIIAVALFFIFRHRKRADKHEKLGSESGSTHNTANASPNSGRAQQESVYPKAELAGSEPPSDRGYSSGGPGSSAATSGGTNTLSSGGTNTPRSPHNYSGSTWARGDSNSNSPISPNGEGTQSSTQSNGAGTMLSAISPSSPAPNPLHEADSREREIFEMVGDMPVVREKDGHEMTEKEAQARREWVYNGVETPPSSAAALPAYSEHQRQRSAVNPDDVALSSTRIDDGQSPSQRPINFSRHRAFSFEGSARGSQIQDRDHDHDHDGEQDARLTQEWIRHEDEQEQERDDEEHYQDSEGSIYSS